MQKNAEEYIISSEKELDEIAFSIIPGDRIFFSGDLGVGKSTFIRSIIRRYMNNPSLIVRSPTYTYYQKYSRMVKLGDSRIAEKDPSAEVYKSTNLQVYQSTIYHCDLYRLEDYSTWISIGGEEIVQDPDSIMLIEWPEILGSSIVPTKKVSIEVMENGERRVIISSN